jgi:hypothetical protein
MYGWYRECVNVLTQYERVRSILFKVNSSLENVLKQAAMAERIFVSIQLSIL